MDGVTIKLIFEERQVALSYWLWVKLLYFYFRHPPLNVCLIMWNLKRWKTNLRCRLNVLQGRRFSSIAIVHSCSFIAFVEHQWFFKQEYDLLGRVKWRRYSLKIRTDENYSRILCWNINPDKIQKRDWIVFICHFRVSTIQI